MIADSQFLSISVSQVLVSRHFVTSIAHLCIITCAPAYWRSRYCFRRVCPCVCVFVRVSVHAFIHFASELVAVDSSHMFASSSTSWSSFNPPSNFVVGTCRLCGSWSVAGHNHRKVAEQDSICADLHGMCLASPETVEQRPCVAS